MTSPFWERAVSDARQHGRALLKFISPNDAGLTGSHQCGFYLPRGAWQMYTTQSPTSGLNHKHHVNIVWQDGRVTNSVVTWYGVGTRSEYRLTRFGRDFPFLTEDSVGNLLVLIPVRLTEFRAYVLDLEEDIDELQAALGVEVIDTWAVYEFGRQHVETEDECVDRHFREFAASLADFPAGDAFSNAARMALLDCTARFAEKPADDRLLRAIEAEYQLFRLVERQICGPQIHRMFQSVDEFLGVASSITNRRKARAGRSFENHLSHILRGARIPFDLRPNVDGRPDIVIPGAAEYRDDAFPLDRLFVVGLKTTCKDRWRQVLNEGRRVPRKHIVTLQRGISRAQLDEMVSANVSLIVPAGLHREYPADSTMTLQGVESFINTVRTSLAS